MVFVIWSTVDGFRRCPCFIYHMSILRLIFSPLISIEVDRGCFFPCSCVNVMRKTHWFLKIHATSFGQSSNNPFGSSSVFGQNNNPNNDLFVAKPSVSSSPFGSQTGSSIFGGTSTSVFGTQASSPVFDASSTPAFTSSMPAFGASSSPFFGVSSSSFDSSSVFGQMPASSRFRSTTQSSYTESSFQKPKPATSSSFSFGSSPAFGQSTSAFGSNPFGATSTTVGVQSSPSGCRCRFCQPCFGGQQNRGTRVIPYADTPDSDSYAGKLKSISAMHAYKEKSHGELRWEDYQRGDKGGLDPAARSSGGKSFNPFAPMPSSISSTNPFGPMTSTFRSTPSLGSSPFGPAACNPFKSTPSPAPSAIGSTSSFGPTPMIITTPTLVQPSFSFSPFWSTQPPLPFWSTGGTSSNFGRVVDKRAPMKISCALTSRHLSKTCPKNFSFISNEEKTTSTTPAFGQPSFEVPQRGRTRVIPYGPTTVTEYEYGSEFAGNMESISAMLAYKEQSHEELRWADYQVGDEGGPILMLNLFVEWSLK
uniref:Nucleoporin autopeptidase n=1 Tax=Helianthus annuus TaxID=4232 RepID=A0A251VA50_HELAN